MGETFASETNEDRATEMISAISERLFQPSFSSRPWLRMPTDPANRLEVRSASENQVELSEDQIFDLLSNQRRRFIFQYFKQHSSTSVSLRELSEQITAWEVEKLVEELTHDERRRVYTSLQQFHLSKMESCGAIEYDQRRGVVRFLQNAKSFNIYLDTIDRDGDTRSPDSADVFRVGFSLGIATWLILALFIVQPVVAQISSYIRRLQALRSST